MFWHESLAERQPPEAIRQHCRAGCGPAAAKMFLDHYGIESDLEGLHSEMECGPQGTTMLRVKKAIESRGLKCQGLRVPEDRLEDIPLPAIAHVHGDHFAVIRSVKLWSEMIVDDPSLGRLKMTVDLFGSHWDGVVLVHGYDPRPVLYRVLEE